MGLKYEGDRLVRTGLPQAAWESLRAIAEKHATTYQEKPMEKFVVKHYTSEERPTIKGNGFDGLEVGEDREEAERFVAFVNAIRAQALEEAAEICETAPDGLQDSTFNGAARAI